MSELIGDSKTVSTDAVLGTNAVVNGKAAGVHGVSKNAGPGVLGESVDGRGVQGVSTNNYGVRAHSEKIAGLRASSTVARAIEGWGIKDDGVWGISTEATGVHGISEKAGTGVVGESKTGRGVHGFSDTWQGVYGHSNTNAGIVGESEKFHAVYGVSHDVNNGGVIGLNLDHNNNLQGFGVIGRGNTGVSGESKAGRGVQGMSETWQGVYGHSNTNAGVVGESDQFDGVFGVSHHPAHAGVSGHNLDSKGNPVKGGMAGYFNGDVIVTGDIKLTGGNDIAERFSVVDTDTVLPGCVMTFGEDGTIQPCNQSYDKKAVGVISGAGSYKPGLLLGDDEKEKNKMPIALMGKVFCYVDAGFAPVEVGDLLTTSSTPGHAMKATDPMRAFGAVIGKALQPLQEGKGIISMLVALQ